MKTFEDLEFFKDDLDGISAGIIFENHFGVSVVRNSISYGNKKGLYELAVIYMSPEMEESEIHYDNPVAQGNVRGYLTPEDVTELMKQVSELTI